MAVQSSVFAAFDLTKKLALHLRVDQRLSVELNHVTVSSMLSAVDLTQVIRLYLCLTTAVLCFLLFSQEKAKRYHVGKSSGLRVQPVNLSPGFDACLNYDHDAVLYYIQKKTIEKRI